MKGVKQTMTNGMAVLFTIAARGKPSGDAKMVSNNAKSRKM